MKVLMLNGSANQKGCTYTALQEIGRTLQAEGIDYEIFQIGAQPVRDCIGCRQCTEQGCIFMDDLVNVFVQKAREADGFVFGTPVYYAHASGRILSFMDRAFYSSKGAFIHKPAAAVASARRAGTTASLDDLSAICPQWVPAIGTWCMATVRRRYCRMWRDCRPCAISPTIWLGC